MALQISLENGFGVFPQCYAKVQSFFGDKQVINFEVFFYANDQARLDNKDPIQSSRYFVSWDPTLGANMTQLYDHLKTLPEFAGALDV